MLMIKMGRKFDINKIHRTSCLDEINKINRVKIAILLC